MVFFREMWLALLDLKAILWPLQQFLWLWHGSLRLTYACRQFYQHFAISFCTDFLAPKKLQSQTVIREKLCKALLYEKGWSKMLMKLTPGQLSSMKFPEKSYTICFFEVGFFGSFGQLAVQAAQIWAVFGRQTW